MKIKILYEDKDILVIDKPSGISVHPDGRSKESTITDWVLKNYPKLKGIGEPITFDEKEIDRPGIVHRLDKDTSGVLLIVKNAKSFTHFKKQFMNREIKKKYMAIVNGWVKNDHGIINKPIGRSPSDFRRRLAGRGSMSTTTISHTSCPSVSVFTAQPIQLPTSLPTVSSRLVRGRLHIRTARAIYSITRSSPHPGTTGTPVLIPTFPTSTWMYMSQAAPAPWQFAGLSPGIP